MQEQTIPQILQRLAELRGQLPADRNDPVPAHSSWLSDPRRDDRLLWALEQAGAIFVELDQEARILFVSSNVEAITGFAPDEFRGFYVGDRVHPDDFERLVDVSRAMGAGKAPDRPRLRARHKNGGWVHLEAVSAARFRAADGRIHSVSVLCDVTARQETWEALRETEERYRVIVESSSDAVLELDEQARTTYLSDALCRTFGFTAEQLSAMPPLSLIHPDDRSRVLSRLREAFHTGETVQIAPFRVRHREDRWIWYECTGLTYRRANGGRRFLAMGRDVTERLRRDEERRSFEVRMQQAQRLESLGVLAGGIAHDFNNLLTPILGEARLALADLPASSPLRERIERILRAAYRAAELTQQMLANTGSAQPRADAVDLSALVDEMARLVEPSTESVDVSYELEKSLPSVEGDAAQIGQIVTNLVTNAFESLVERPARIAIRTGEVQLEASPTDSPVPFDPPGPGRYVYLEVEDTGCGMDDDTQERIFDPFFTTKFTGRGLGLAAVLGIVRAHEGGIEIDTRPGDGTRIRVLFPADRMGSPPAHA